MRLYTLKEKNDITQFLIGQQTLQYFFKTACLFLQMQIDAMTSSVDKACQTIGKLVAFYSMQGPIACGY